MCDVTGSIPGRLANVFLENLVESLWQAVCCQNRPFDLVTALVVITKKTVFDTPGHMKGLVPVVEYKKEKKTEQFLFSFNRPRIKRISWKNMRHIML